MGIVDMLRIETNINQEHLTNNEKDIPIFEEAILVDNFDFVYEDVLHMLTYSEDYLSVWNSNLKG